MPTRVNEGTSEFGSDDGLVTAYMYEKPWYYAHSDLDPTGTTIAKGWKPEADM